ncbi:hypothetical protein BGW80DRAFT_1465121 [Lactifluus volemus]|nr:hypothetical protein BGW80DRAFT_1465121 [Lactifluus volemus]
MASLVTSPILTHISWSPLVTAPLAANAPIIHPALSDSTPSDFVPSSAPTTLSCFLALHIRRGDYLEHCKDIANWSARFMGFNEFPGLPGRFLPPAVHSQGHAPPEELARYRAHCFPEIDQIVSRVRDARVRADGRPEWLQELKNALQEDARTQGMDEWEHIGTSRDLRLTREQRHNSQAVDMAIAQRSEIFIGNGSFSVFHHDV